MPVKKDPMKIRFIVGTEYSQRIARPNGMFGSSTARSADSRSSMIPRTGSRIFVVT